MNTNEKMVIELLSAIGLGVNAKIVNPGWYARMLNKYTTNKFSFKYDIDFCDTDSCGNHTDGFILSYNQDKQIHSLRVEAKNNRITNLMFQ